MKVRKELITGRNNLQLPGQQLDAQTSSGAVTASSARSMQSDATELGTWRS